MSQTVGIKVFLIFLLDDRRIWIRVAQKHTVGTGSGNATLPSNFVSCETHSEYYYQCCESGMFIPDPTFFHPGSRMPTENYFFSLFFYFLQATIHLHQSLKIISHKEVAEQ
jgi:hypothetical protein